MEKKFVIINRAVPSSGKSTISRIISEGLAKMGYIMKIHSTDEYFMFDGKYVFDIKHSVYSEILDCVNKSKSFDAITHIRNLTNETIYKYLGDDVEMPKK